MRAQICALGMREIKSAQTKVWGNEGMTIRKMDGITFIRSMEPREFGQEDLNGLMKQNIDVTSGGLYQQAQKMI